MSGTAAGPPSEAPRLRLRRAVDADAVAFYRWWNDADTRRYSQNTAAVSWEAHLEWFTRNVGNPHWYVGEIREPPAGEGHGEPQWLMFGVVRFDRRDDATWVSIVIDPLHRGRRLGHWLLVDATAAFRRQPAPAGAAFARVHRDNGASMKLFAGAGYSMHHAEGVWTIFRTPEAS